MVLTRDSVLGYMQRESYRPLTYMELSESLCVEDHENFGKLLRKLEKEGEVILTRKNKYGLPEAMNLLKGALQVHPKGYAFLLPDDPTLQDIYIYGRDLNGAMHNDRVLVRLNHHPRGFNGRPEGEVVRVIHRANKEVVGTYRRSRSGMQVIPDDPRMVYPISVKASKKKKINDGEKVVVRLTVYPDKDRMPEGTVTELLGAKGDPGVDIISIIKKFGLRVHFPGEVIAEAKAMPETVQEEELAGRRDLRDQMIVTIDGDDAKDLDDAVIVTRQENGGYRLGVHIADVSHYVVEESHLDKEAVARGTSVYLPDRVLPMLPRELSNNICSLNAGVDRLAMSVIVDMDDDGEIIDYEIHRSVILVKERMTYKNVNKILKDRDPELMERYRDFVPIFEEMKQLADILKKRRLRLGTLDFNFPEAKVIVDDDGNPIAIEKRFQDVAESIIEEFMIRANEVVAMHLNKRGVPTLYRVHERPAPEGIDNMNRLLAGFGLRLQRKDDMEPIDMQEILHQIQGKPEERLVSTVMLRSMKHARYTPVPLGHFGLASPFYAHFTSPIRRYPDLMVHRGLGQLLDHGKLPAKKKAFWEKRMTVLGEQCTLNEMKAEECEREAVQMKMAQYMKQYEGNFFKAVISSVTAFGFFIELDNLVEGLVHISSLADDYYLFDDTQLRLIGKNTRKIYAIGDPVEVQLVRVAVDDAKLDFELAAE